MFDQIPGPVLAVGHSYGGAVISNAATRSQNVVGLVYVAAFAPDEGEKLGDVTASSKDSVLGSALVPRQYPTGSGTGTEFLIDPAKARDAFAADLTDAQAALIGTIQRPVADLAFGEPSGVPAWKTLPSWAVVATNDRAAGTDVVRAHAQRAGATDHRGRRLARDHDLAATSRHRRDPGRDRQAQLTWTEPRSDRCGRSTLVCWTSDTWRSGRSTVNPSCCCTAGPTTSTATPTSRQRSGLPATG